jgi:hypothetical protein
MSAFDAFARALLDPAAEAPAALRAWNGSDAARRLDVHRNNVVVSLADALAASFPVVQSLVGEPFFRAMARSYLRADPPRSPVLALYGGGLAAFIEGFAPARSLPYLADVARLEFARVQTLHAADALPADPMLLAAALAADALHALPLRPHPSARWMVSRHPVFSLWAAHQGQGRPEDVDLGQPEAVLVVRPALEVLTIGCDPATAAVLAALEQGAALPDACAAAAGCPHFDPAATLGLLLRHGALVLAHRTGIA